jgi:hypothetical protein
MPNYMPSPRLSTNIYASERERTPNQSVLWSKKKTILPLKPTTNQTYEFIQLTSAQNSTTHNCGSENGEERQEDNTKKTEFLLFEMIIFLHALAHKIHNKSFIYVRTCSILNAHNLVCNFLLISSYRAIVAPPFSSHDIHVATEWLYGRWIICVGDTTWLDGRARPAAE